MSTTTDDLLAYIFDGQSHILTQSMARWLASSRRFTTFVSTFRDKIRKKFRATRDPESLLDLRLELETAYLLLQERSLSLVYEPDQAERTRGPDFAVSFTTSLTFMVEDPLAGGGSGTSSGNINRRPCASHSDSGRPYSRYNLQ